MNDDMFSLEKRGDDSLEPSLRELRQRMDDDNTTHIVEIEQRMKRKHKLDKVEPGESAWLGTQLERAFDDQCTLLLPRIALAVQRKNIDITGSRDPKQLSRPMDESQFPGTSDPALIRRIADQLERVAGEMEDHDPCVAVIDAVIEMLGTMNFSTAHLSNAEDINALHAKRYEAIRVSLANELMRRASQEIHTADERDNLHFVATTIDDLVKARIKEGSPVATMMGRVRTALGKLTALEFTNLRNEWK